MSVVLSNAGLIKNDCVIVMPGPACPRAILSGSAPTPLASTKLLAKAIGYSAAWLVLKLLPLKPERWRWGCFVNSQMLGCPFFKARVLRHFFLAKMLVTADFLP